VRPGAWLLGAAVAAFALSACSAASVAVVGDSLGVGTEPHLRAALPGVATHSMVSVLLNARISHCRQRSRRRALASLAIRVS
jgi:hypothetical protein